MDNICLSPSDTPKECGLTDVEDGQNEEPYYLLNNVRSNNIDRPIIAHLNINFLYQKIEPLKDLVKSSVDILVISETKLDNSFPMGEFEIEGYSTPIGLDRNCHGGGIILYVRSDLPCKELNTRKLPNDVEGIFAELNNLNMNNFCETYDLKNLINEPTCYKNAINTSSIDVILTNRPRRFHNSMAIGTVLSDHHKMVLTVLKSYCKKIEPILTTYRDSKHFDENIFRSDLVLSKFSRLYTIMKYEDFKNIFMEVLDVHAPLK